MYIMVATYAQFVRGRGRLYNYFMSEIKASDLWGGDKPAVSSNIKVFGAGEDNPKVCTTGCEG